MSQALPLVWITWICAAGAYVAAQGGQPTLRSFTPTEEVVVTGAEVAPSAARAGSSTFAFRGAARCSPDGTAALVPYLPGAPAGSVVRVERDGRRTVVQLATALDVSPDHIDIGAIAHGDSGKVYVLVLTADVDSRVPRQVLSVSSDGSVRRIGNVQEGDDFIARDLAVMTSGDVLLAGVRPHSGRLATSILTDAGVQSPVLELPTVEPAAGIYAAAGSSDGAYVVDERNAQAFRIDTGNRLQQQYALAQWPPTARLHGIQIAGDRLASLYSDVIDSSSSLKRFVAVQELPSGKPLGVYGPLDGLVLCFTTQEGAHELTLLSVTRNGWTLKRGRMDPSALAVGK